jgi:hypothetical protein
MTTTVGVFTSSVDAETWEPLSEDGEEIGQVHWLVQADGHPIAGLWRDEPEEGAELPYRVTGFQSHRLRRLSDGTIAFCRQHRTPLAVGKGGIPVLEHAMAGLAQQLGALVHV